MVIDENDESLQFARKYQQELDEQKKKEDEEYEN